MHRPISLILILSLSTLLTGFKTIQPVTIASFNHDSPGIKVIEARVIEIYKKADIAIEIKRFSMARALVEAKAGRVDALIGHPKGSEADMTDFTPVGDSIRKLQFAAFSTAKKGLSFNEYKIILLRGMPFVEKALEQKGIKFVTHPEVETIADLLRMGRYDTTIMAIDNAKWGAKKVPGLQQVSDVIAEFPIVHYVSKKRPEVIEKLKALLRVPATTTL